MFTKGITDCMVCNDGDVRCEPVFTVMCKKVGENTDQHGFLIQNHTTGHSLQLEYDMAKNEMITIDIAKRQIVSNLQTEDNYNGNLIYFLSDDSFFAYNVYGGWRQPFFDRELQRSRYDHSL